MIILYYPKLCKPKNRRFPLSVLALAAVLEGREDYQIVDGNLEPDPDAVIRALAPFRPFPPQFGSADSFVWDRRSFVGAVLELVTDVGHIDVLLVQPGVDSFEGLLSRSESRSLEDIKVQVASIDDLIAMKSAAGRPKDIDHIRQLHAIKAVRENRS